MTPHKCPTFAVFAFILMSFPFMVISFSTSTIGGSISSSSSSSIAFRTTTLTIPTTTRKTTSSSSSTTTITSSRTSSRSSSRSSSRLYSQTPSFPSYEELNNQKSEALKALSTYHDGTWINKKGAISFSITSDVTAGMTNIKRSSSYQTNVSTRLGLSGTGEGGEVLKLVETLSWEQKKKKKKEEGEETLNGSANVNGNIGNTFFGRSCPLGNTMDVDSVDGSYSLHSYSDTKSNDNNDNENDDEININDTSLLPKAITGIDGSIIISSIVEQCLVVNENERIRCFLCYSKSGLLGQSTNTDVDSQEEKLVRVVICHEQKATPVPGVGNQGNNDSLDLLEMAEDKSKTTVVDDDLLDKLASVMGKPTVENEMNKCPISMMTLSLGPWLGDLVIRDKSYNEILPTASVKKGGTSNRGFGAPKKTSSSKKTRMRGNGGGFGEWVIGVQKASMQFKWDYGSSVRHCLQFGKSLGCYCEDWPLSSSGTIYEERMSRRLKPEDRTMYIDYDMGAYCGFIVGSVYVKAPRLLSFSKAKNGNPIHTEFAVFQKTEDEAPEEEKETWCSRITRTYSADGFLKQGSTSFFTLKPIAEPFMDDVSP